MRQLLNGLSDADKIVRFLDSNIAPVGMGCWAIGGAFYAGDQSLGFANVDDAVSIQTVHAAVDESFHGRADHAVDRYRK